ncbi:MAG: asparagine synthase (glutamine-hydrolyzing) [Acidobacteria bacterium]|nr:asparagine synthase (glutamine-hydrolyzing) [Acidobacteriota bacterium]
MCGIVGIVERDLERPVVLEELTRMVHTLQHRGPDEEGSVTLPGVGLGMRRLSIVDLAGGQQPFANETGAIQLVANGEIYNFEEVKRDLVARGHLFRSRADTEVLVHAYEEYGESFLRRLRGMFALALWDGRTRTLLAARDRAGEKPLYYTLTSRGLLLASEIKALLVRPEVPRTLDPEALDQFLTYEYVVAPLTIFKSIRKLPAAHYLVYRDGAVTVKRYWDAADRPVRFTGEGEAVEALRSALGRAVEGQMMSDVPLGVFLSGGIDSSAIVAFMSDAARRHGGEVNTFSMGFDDGSYNELPFAREVAARFTTRHHEGTVTPRVADLFDKLVVHLDEPFADVSLFPTYLVSQMAREHVKVVLAGDGGDELFGGYDTYIAQRVVATWSRLVPGAAIDGLQAAVDLFPPSAKKKGLVNKLRRLLQGAARGPASIAQYRWMTYLGPSEKRKLYRPYLLSALAASDVYQPVRDVLAHAARPNHAGEHDLLNRQLYADLSVYLADDILVKVDRMSMATSLETRAPFLDVDVMELAFSLPGSLKIRGHERKYILKRALDPMLPASILSRGKQGFSIPMKNWLRRELQPLMQGLLSADRLTQEGLFEPAEVTRLMDEHLAGRENHAHVLFSLMVFERWASEFGAAEGAVT